MPGNWKTGGNIYIYIFFFHLSISKILSEDNKCLELEMWQGPPTINKAEQCEIVFAFEVSSFLQFVQSSKRREIKIFPL